MSNKKDWVLYIWVTSDIEKRIFEHKNKIYLWFTSKYNLDKLVWFVELPTIKEAIELEKKLKSGNRLRKIQLIESINSNWDDLSFS